jgi:glycosyltransferase involved in cell wall biosynthesis
MQKRFKPSVLVIGPGRMVRGGTTSVIALLASQPQWREYRCEWLATHDDRNKVAKVWAAVQALVRMPIALLGKDIVHIHATVWNSFIRKSIFFFLAKCFGKSVVVHLHAPSAEMLFDQTCPPLVRRVLLSADAVIVLSPYWESEVKRRLPSARVVVIPNAVASVGTEPRQRISRMVLFAGELQDRKGYQDLIRAMAIVLEAVPDAKLTMAGHGAVSQARVLAEELGISRSIEFPGWLRGEAKEQVFRRADVFCLPSYHEGVPMAVLEAMSFGLPVVVTPVGGLPDVVQEGENGYLVPCGDIPALAKALLRLLENPDLCRRMGDAASKMVQERFNIVTVWARLGDLYDRLSGG